MNKSSLDLQARKIDEYRQRSGPIEKTPAGMTITVLPGIYPGGTDTELLAETMEVRPGDRVLDLCTGTGIVALKAAVLGAVAVIGTDINPNALENAQLNQKRLKLDTIRFVEGNPFPETADRFNVITINPPYTNAPAPDLVARCFWDEGNQVIRSFFVRLHEFLEPHGSAYLTWSNFADQKLLDQLAKKQGYRLVERASRAGKSGFTYSVYQVTFA